MTPDWKLASVLRQRLGAPEWYTSDIAAALRDYGDERASEMRERAAMMGDAALIDMNNHNAEHPHSVGYRLASRRIAAAIRALPTTPPTTPTQ